MIYHKEISPNARSEFERLGVLLVREYLSEEEYLSMLSRAKRCIEEAT